MKEFYEARDASLRRKLFATDDSSETSSVGPANTSIEIDFDAISPAPQTPELDLNPKSRIGLDNQLEGETLTVQIDALSPIGERRESFGALSPIERTSESEEPAVETPPSPVTKRRSGSASDSSIYQSTPGKQTPRDDLSMSIDDVPRTAPAAKALATSLNSMFGDPPADWELSSHEDSICNYLTQEETAACIDVHPSPEDYYRPDDHNHNTPLRPRTQTSRKNLSRSFNMLTNFSDDEEVATELLPELQQVVKKSKSFSTTFRRMDSGFTDDFSSSQASMERIKASASDDLDISMRSQDENRFICSTPSNFF
jgi:hypothetical protein